MPNLNPFAKKTSSYHRLSHGATDGESDACISPSSTLRGEECDADKELLLSKGPRRSLRSCLMHACGYIFVAFLGLSIGLGFSRLLSMEHDIDGYLTPYGSPHRRIEKVVWSLNESFAGEPSAETEKMWKSLIPKGRAFVQHPKLAKEIKSMSVFHELHCLHGLRQMYYKKSYLLSKHQHHESQRSPLSPPHIKIETTPSSHEHHSTPTFTPNPFLEALLSSGEEHDDPDHIQHCFEYLRQALICAADTNLEDTKEEVGEDGVLGVATKGWGTERVCRDFEAVKEWAVRWRVGDYQGIT